MSHMTITVDGEVWFDDDVNSWQLPAPDASAISNAIEQATQPGRLPAPFMKTMMIQQIAKLMLTVFNSKGLQPLNVTFDNRGAGFTMVVDIPEPGFEGVVRDQ